MLRVSTLFSRPITVALPLSAVLLAASAAHAQVTISNTGNGGVGAWGGQAPRNIPTFGQSITAPNAVNQLTSFTLNLAAGTGGQAYRAYVYAWDPIGVTTPGPALYTSAVLTAPSGATPVTISTGGVAVTAGNQYALFFSTLQQPTSTGYYLFSFTDNPSSYTGGEALYNVSDPFESGWRRTTGDMAFSATFINAVAAAPEPGTIVLLLSAGIPVAGLVRRRNTTR